MKPIKSIVAKCITIVVLVILLVVLIILKNNPDIAEAMTRGPARIYGLIFSKVSGAIPFVSLTEVLFLVLIIIGIITLVLIIINIFTLRILKAVSKLLNLAVIALNVVVIYHFSCEAAYNRKEMPLPYYEGDVERTEYIDLYNFFANDINACVSELEFTDKGDVKNDYSVQEIGEKVKKAYEILTDSYFFEHSGSVKPMLSSFIYREFQIVGVTFNPFSEANINTMDTKGDLPFTIAHELAHTKGVMREDDANKLALYVCLNSDDPYLRFSAYTRYFDHISVVGSSSFLTDEERAHLVSIDNKYYKFGSYQYKYWKDHNLLKLIGDFFNNLYIKSSGVPEGTDSYEGGTTYVYDPTEHKIETFSDVQKIFLEKYYR